MPRLPYNFRDRVLRDALLQPDNLRALIREVAPDIADRLDYTRIEIVGKPYFLDDWRSRERDILVRLPYLDASGQREVLACILVEHQSDPDPVMPLRMLVYAVFFWEQEWKTWEESHQRGDQLRLTPILPVVLHTGSQTWDTNRSLSELFDVPTELRGWLPQWAMPLWDLPEHSVEDLVKSDEAFWQALAVARAERAPTDEFLQVLREALIRLEPLGTSQHVRWDQLLRLVLHWSLFRRPGREHEEVLRTARESHENVELKREVDNMSVEVERTYEEEFIEKIERKLQLKAEREMEEKMARAVASAVAVAEANGLRSALLNLLQMRFQTLPDEFLLRVAAADGERLKAAFPSVLTARSLDDVPL